MDKANLQTAKKQKMDEFYTQLTDIEKELRHYRDQFRGKVVFCNCDDPYESNFFKYFANNFRFLELKKLIATSYMDSPIAGDQLPLFEIEGLKPEGKQPFAIEISDVPDANDDGAIDLGDVELLLKSNKNSAWPLKGNGDFRSEECVEFLKEADIVVTNPPFSLFREFLAQLETYGKEFLIIGNTNALTYQEVFRMFKEDRIRTGYTNFNVGMYFVVPDYWSKYHRRDENGNKLVRVSTSCWYTNLDTTKRHELLTLYKRYSASEYPNYDNYDAIEVDRYIDIPFDYPGVMGVPITFLDKYNPDQFEILGWTRGRKEFDAWPIKKYVNARQLKPDGSETSGGKVNTGPNLLLHERPSESNVYVADGVNGYLKQVYMRVLVRNRHPEGGSGED